MKHIIQIKVINIIKENIEITFTNSLLKPYF